MGEHSSKAFTTSKLGKMEASGAGPRGTFGDKAAHADDYGREAAKTSDSSCFALGGAAKKPSMGRAGRASGGRVARAEGGKVRDITKVTDAGPLSYGDMPFVKDDGLKRPFKPRASGGRVGRANGGRSEGARDAEDEARVSKMSGADKEAYANEQRGGRISRAKGGRAKGKTVVNVIVGGRDRDQQQAPQAPPPMPMAPPPPCRWAWA